VDLDRQIPMRWPCGPLEIERAKRREGFTAREGEVLEQWSRPGALDRLAGSPVTCLILTWAEGSPGDEGHQRALAPLITAARRLGLFVVGEVTGGAELRGAVGAAQAAGVAAVATESGEAVEGFPVLASASAASTTARTGTSWLSSATSGPA
jgi:hypothetical protein